MPIWSCLSFSFWLRDHTKEKKSMHESSLPGDFIPKGKSVFWHLACIIFSSLFSLCSLLNISIDNIKMLLERNGGRTPIQIVLSVCVHYCKCRWRQTSQNGIFWISFCWKCRACITLFLAMIMIKWDIDFIRFLSVSDFPFAMIYMHLWFNHFINQHKCWTSVSYVTGRIWTSSWS